MLVGGDGGRWMGGTGRELDLTIQSYFLTSFWIGFLSIALQFLLMMQTAGIYELNIYHV